MNNMSEKGQAHQRPTYLANQNYMYVQFWGQWLVVASMTREIGGNQAVYYVRSAHAFSAGIIYRHCSYGIQMTGM